MVGLEDWTLVSQVEPELCFDLILPPLVLSPGTVGGRPHSQLGLFRRLVVLDWILVIVGYWTFLSIFVNFVPRCSHWFHL